MKPVFTVRYITERVVPAIVEFEEINGRIRLWDYGDGKFGYYDTSDQTKIRHTYKKDGTFKVFARSTTDELSDPVEVIILPKNTPDPEPTPEKESLWIKLIDWLKSIFG